MKLYSYIGIGKYLGVCQNFSTRGRPGGAGPLNVNLKPPIISETTAAKMLKLKTQLDVVSTHFGYKNFSTSWHPGGTWPPNANFGSPDILETTRARKMNLKIPLDVVKYSLWVQKLLYYTIQHEGGRHIDF